MKATAAMEAASKLSVKSTNADRNAAGVKVAQAQMAALAIEEKKQNLAAAEAKKKASEQAREAKKKERADAILAKRAEADETRESIAQGTILGNVYTKVAEYVMKVAVAIAKLTV